MADVGKRLSQIAILDTTGGLQVADCKHGFRDEMIVKCPDGWRLIWWGSLPVCKKCGARDLGTLIFSRRVDFCHHCGVSLQSPVLPLRNYIIFNELPVDEHLLGIGAFEPFEAKQIIAEIESQK